MAFNFYEQSKYQKTAKSTFPHCNSILMQKIHTYVCVILSTLNCKKFQYLTRFPTKIDGANVLFFTFINPDSMKVPKSFEKLAKTRGTRAEGAVPSDTVIMFAIGGQLYSQDYNPWHWLTSKEAAEAMAIEVATWPDRYGCDGLGK